MILDTESTLYSHRCHYLSVKMMPTDSRITDRYSQFWTHHRLIPPEIIWEKLCLLGSVQGQVHRHHMVYDAQDSRRDGNLPAIFAYTLSCILWCISLMRHYFCAKFLASREKVPGIFCLVKMLRLMVGINSQEQLSIRWNLSEIKFWPWLKLAVGPRYLQNWVKQVKKSQNFLMLILMQYWILNFRANFLWVCTLSASYKLKKLVRLVNSAPL